MSHARPTLTDVARAAGVSVSTASLAFSSSGPIAESTRARVLDAARELGYGGPNPAGRQLRSGRYDIVGVVIGDQLKRSFRDPVSVQVLDGLTSSLGEASLGVLLVPGVDSAVDGEVVVDPLLMNAGMDVAVLIWGTHTDDPRVEALRRRGVPIVVGEGNEVDGASLVEIDDHTGILAAVRHLTELGHERFATITLPFRMGRRSGWVDDSRRELVDWTPTRHRLDAMFDSGVDLLGIYETEASLVENGAEAMRAIMRRFPDPATWPTAIVAQSDLLAAGAVLALRDAGLRVPEDVSVAGFDGLDLPWFSGQLTTVVQPLEAKGRAMGDAVRRLLADGTVTRTTMPVELRIGTTTGPVARP